MMLGGYAFNQVRTMLYNEKTAQPRLFLKTAIPRLPGRNPGNGGGPRYAKAPKAVPEARSATHGPNS